MKISHTSGLYLEPASGSFSDAETIHDLFSDWVSGPINLNTALDWVSETSRHLNDVNIKLSTIPHIYKSIVLLKLADATAVGALQFSYFPKKTVTDSLTSKSGFQVHKAIIKKDERGKGYFTTMFLLIAWFATEFLKSDEGFYHSIDSAPQVARKTGQRSTTDGDTEVIPEAYTQTENFIYLSAFSASFTTAEKAAVSLTVDGSVVTPP